MINSDKIDINVDMGEGFGNYDLGNDAEIMKYNTSANIACGFHAGDPSIMNETVKMAKESKTAIGPHMGLPDLRGFGRRKMDISVSDLKDDFIYQIGAFKAFAERNGMELQHVKPHGALYSMFVESEKYSRAYVEAVMEYDPSLIILAWTETKVWEVVKEIDANYALEVFPDLNYDSDGHLVLEGKKEEWSPEEVARRAVSAVKDNELKTVKGEVIECNADTICLHGDAPNSADIVRSVRRKLEEEGVQVKRMSKVI